MENLIARLVAGLIQVLYHNAILAIDGVHDHDAAPSLGNLEGRL